MRHGAFFRHLGLVLLLITVACGPPRSPGSRSGYSPRALEGQGWEQARHLPAAAQALRDAGVAEADLDMILATAQRSGTEASDLLPAMQAIAAATEAHGPVGDLGPWMRDRLRRDGLHGEVLLRLIQAHYTAYGFENLRLPSSEPPTATPPPGVEPAPPSPPAPEPQPSSQIPSSPGASS